MHKSALKALDKAQRFITEEMNIVATPFIVDMGEEYGRY